MDDTKVFRKGIPQECSFRKNVHTARFFQSSFQAGQPIRLSLGGQSSLDPVPVKRRSDIGPSAGACEHRWWFGLEVVLTWDYNERWYCYRRPRALPSEHFKLVSIEGLPISAKVPCAAHVHWSRHGIKTPVVDERNLHSDFRHEGLALKLGRQ